MVNESKNMYIPEDTLENHQGMLCLFLVLFIYLFNFWLSGKHLATVHERGRGGMWREGDDLEMGMGCGEVEGGGKLEMGRWKGGKGKGGGVSSWFSQMDKCSSSSLHFQPPSFSFCVQFCLFDSTPLSLPFSLRAVCAASQLVP